MFSIQLFGSPRTTLNGQDVSVERRKSRALLYYLAANPLPILRDALIALFWPDLEQSAARQVLRTTLYGLRRDLGDLLTSERDSVGLAVSVQVDARAFDQALKPLPVDIAQLSAGLEWYRGQFLEGFNLLDAPEFDNWQTIQREHYLRLAVRGLGALSRAFEQKGDHAQALGALERALVLDPLQEDLQRESIRLAYLAGDRAGAIRRYDHLRRLLDDELGVPPMLETRALYDDILADRVAAAKIVASTPVANKPARLESRPASGEVLPFLSRENELRSLQEKLFSGKLLLVEGEPGIGKTRLVNEYLAGQPVLALVGSGRELEQALPYQPVIEALRGLAARPDWHSLRGHLAAELPALWLQETARLLPDLDAPASGTAAADEWRLLEGISQFLQVLARQYPVVLFLDDLHWADASTLRLLGYLLRQPAQSIERRIGYIAATRPYPARSALANLAHTLTRAGLLERIKLERFSAEEIGLITRQIHPLRAVELAGWLEETTEGNPYILTEVLRTARQQGLLGTPENPGEVYPLDLDKLRATDVLPGSVYSLIQSRLARLSEPARRMLDTAVAIGRDFDFEITAHTAALSEDVAIDGMDELLASGLVTASGGTGYRFDHSLTMEVAYRDVGELRHRRIHRQVAEAMEGLYPRSRLEQMAGQMAFHFTEGHDMQRAAPYALIAGRRAARLAAWQEAARFLQMALAGTEGRARIELLMELGKAYRQAGEAARAVELYREALQMAEDLYLDAKVDLILLAMIEALVPQARFSESIVLAQQVLERGRPEYVFAARLWLGTVLSIEGADLDAAAGYLAEADAMNAPGANPVDISHVKFELGSVEAQKGNIAAAVQHYRAALQAVLEVSSHEGLERRLLAYNNLAYHLHLLGDPTALKFAREGMALAREWGMLFIQSYLNSTTGEIGLANGDLALAQSSFEAGLELARRLDIPERNAGLTASLGRLAAAQGENGRAIQLFYEAVEQAEMLGLHHLGAQIRIWLAELLPQHQARVVLAQARELAGTQRRGLLAAIEAVEKKRNSQAD